MKSLISDIKSRMILDSRGNPTVEVEVITNSGATGRAAVPSGASTGTLEAYEVRDGGSKYLGRGVEKAIANIDQLIKPELINLDCSTQEAIDKKLIELDGTGSKEKLGANAILAVSLASVRAFSSLSNKELFELIPNIYGDPHLPTPLMNILNGGAHADNNIDIQEFMIIPHGFDSYTDSLRAGVEVYHHLKEELKSNNMSTNVGDEGGFAPNLNSSSEVIKTIIEAIEKSGYKPEEEVSIALDAAASEFHKDGKYFIEDEELSSIEMVDYLVELANQYPIISIEDGLSEDDWEGWSLLTEKIGDKIQLVGDDLFVTQEKMLERGINQDAANSILIKINQVGSITETLETMNLAKENNYTSMVSHRSGETEDTFISHLVTGTSSGQIKTGAPARSERAAKYNELLRIGEKVGFETFNNKKWKN